MKKKLTRLFSVLLAAVLVLGTLPVSAMGTDVADPPASAWTTRGQRYPLPSRRRLCGGRDPGRGEGPEQ